MLQALSNTSRRTIARSAVIKAPTGGWDASTALAAMPDDRAVELLNWFPQPGYLEVRRGYNYQAWDIVSDTTPVNTLMVWQGQSSSNLLCAATSNIYDISTEGVPSAAVTSLSSSKWQYVNFTNSGATYLIACNGADNVKSYDGTTWAEPAITGVSPSNLIHVNVHKKRLWFTQINSTKAWYLATDAIAGAATSFELGSVFSRGGYLMSMTTWTKDGGSGPDDYAVFISSRGQVAIYEGTDPSSANTWALVGVFDYAAPIGRRCFTRFGSDVLLLTVQGIFALSQTFAVDESNAGNVAVTKNIQTAMVGAARDYGDNFGWEMCVYNKGTRLILNVPITENTDAEQYVMNTLTGAWCRFDNHHANSWAVWNDRLFFASNDGSVYEADVGSADVATPITAVGQTAYQPFRSPGTLKRFTMLQPLVTSSSQNRPSLGISVDFVETSEMSTSSVAGGSGIAQWDVSSWDVAKWAGTLNQRNDWVSIPALGRFASVKFQAQTGIEAVASSGSYWGISLWGAGLWGGTDFESDETMIINGFVALYEMGGYL